jgi:hypothetical protein
MMLIESELSTLGSGLWEFYRRLRLRASFRRENTAASPSSRVSTVSNAPIIAEVMSDSPLSSI